VSNIGLLNSKIIEGRGGDIIKIGEALQQRLFTALSDTIMERRHKGLKLILISGPSSSGKTTFGMRLNIELRVFGLDPVVLSMDNYFVDRDKTPLGQNGKHDFEALEAVDLELFNDNLGRLIAGQEVEVPKFDFKEGRRYYDGTRMRLSPNSVIIVEGIHALNPAVARDIPDDNTFRIYVSALTTISMDNLSRFSTTDNRLLRRIVRDSKYRSHTALDTLRRWGSVRRGEEKNIFPYQEEADYMFNSSLIFEISILKRYAEPLLMEVPDTEKEYSEARRLLKMLDFFMPIDDKEVPPTSLIREFIGGSSFDY
ncbi:MAG: nucleoside kinase, partial [Rikenellaceae bacterium]|nr:nucleoside kinase [Rikenellaceae bacterium]